MGKSNNIQDRIDQYLLNQMQPEERAVFENVMKNDPVLSEKVKIQGLIIEEIRRREDFFSIIKKDEEKTDDPVIIGEVKKPQTSSVQLAIYPSSINEFEKNIEDSKVNPVLEILKPLPEISEQVNTKTQKIFPWKKMLVAAVLIGISVIVFWQPTKYSNKVILDTYAYNNSYESSIKQIWDEGTRSITNSDMGFSSQEILILDSATALFNNENYKIAAEKFEKVNNLIVRNSELSMLMAFSQLKSGLYDKAYTNYFKLTQNSDESIQHEASYYLALTLIGLDENKRARKILREIFESKGLHSVEAEKILKKMRWF